MKRNLITILLIAVLTGCATIETEITRDNNHIQMPHYSVTVPVNEGWRMQRIGGKSENVIISKKIGSTLFRIQLMRNVIVSGSMKTWPAWRVASDYRKLERRNMIELGVNKGLYQLKNVTNNMKEIANKTFYTMDFMTLSKRVAQKASLYLYFPKEYNNDSFIVAHYSEHIPVEKSFEKSFKSYFITILKSLEVK